MRLFFFDWIDEEIRYTLCAVFGAEFYAWRPLQAFLSTGYHVIGFYVAAVTVFIVTYNGLVWLTSR